MATRQTFDISFYCRSSKQDRNGFAPIEISIIINGERNYLSLQRKEKPDEFKKEMASKRSNDLKVYIENQRVLINRIVEEMAFAGIELTAKNLKECIKKGGVTNFYTVGQLWNDIIDNKKAELSSGDLSDNTLQKYLLAKNAFYEANGINDLTPAQEITVQHIINLQNHLRNKGTKQNTLYQYHAKCKAAFSLAFNRGKIRSNPYATYKIDKGERKEIIWLSDKEMNTLKKKEIVIERLSNVRDLFVFQCNSGLSYTDLADVTEKDFQQNNLNQYYIEKYRKKTGERYVSIILKDGVAILEKYAFRLPVLSNQKYNAYLKEIQTICGLEKRLHTHLARTTYICYLYNHQVPPQTIAEIVGHYACTTTLKYYAKMDKTTIFKAVRDRGIAANVKPGRTKKDKTEKVVKVPNFSILEEIKTTGIKMK